MIAYLIRHAEAAGQAEDAPLTARGQLQANRLQATLAQLDAGPLYSSPMTRALNTLAPFAFATDQEITVIDALRERLLSTRNLPDWQDHMRRSFQEDDYAAPGGESHAALLSRWRAAFTVIANGGGTPAFCTHGAMTAALFHSIDPTFGFDGWQQMGTPDLFELTLDGSTAKAFRRIDLNLAV